MLTYMYLFMCVHVRQRMHQTNKCEPNLRRINTHTHAHTHWGTNAGPLPVAYARAVVPELLHRRLLHSLVLDLHFGESSVFFFVIWHR